ncbi:39S ribosomal protein L4, mitochondrial [Trichogramma pretiosum]|uniref:Large ribosomal subunit protein uL4m n=1 Tax=Trichogramma kaykai TaxID=54128 RepID=A0ABD2WQT9_9HYME|nr:39S ribosomal protein L4, mitochondrial [Trichogramma pretiosum]
MLRLISKKLLATYSPISPCAQCGLVQKLRSLSLDDNLLKADIKGDYKFLDPDNHYQKFRQVWLENLDTTQEKKLGIISLHPEIFATKPRVDIIHQNITWQRLFRYINYACTKVTSEVRGGGRKPWPQKGMGKARHGSIRSVLWRKGGRAHGPRGPKPYFYMLPHHIRVWGLVSAFSTKLAQDDLHIVKSLDIPTDDPEYVTQLVKERNWGPSVLFIDVSDIMPLNLITATDSIKHINCMPGYGLNVHSILKHNTLVLTEDAASWVQGKLLYHLNQIKPPENIK